MPVHFGLEVYWCFSQSTDMQQMFGDLQLLFIRDRPLSARLANYDRSDYD